MRVVTETVETEKRESPMRAVLRAAAQYSVGSLVTMLGSVARVGVTARVLSDADNGIWLALQLLLNYGGNLHLGSLYGIYRSIPMLRAKGDFEAAEREKRTAFAFILLMTLVAAVGIVALTPRLVQATPLRHVLLTVALLVANLLRMYFSMILRAESRFKELSAAWVIGFVITAAGIPVIIRLKLDGVLISMLAQTIVETAFIAYRVGIPRPKLEMPILKGQLRVGIMTLATTVGLLALTTADRTVMLRMCGAKATGLYYLGANIGTLVPAIALMPTGVLTPKFFERAGRGEDLTPLVWRPLKVMAAVIAMMCGFGAALLPVVVHRIWPNQVGGISAAIAALFATAPIMLIALVTNIFYALDRQGIHVALLIVFGLLAYALGAGGVAAADGAIIGAVIGTALAGTLYYLVTTVLAMRLVGGGAFRALLMAVVELGPTLVVLALFGALAVLEPGWLRGEVRGAAMALAVAAIGSVPFVPRAVRAFRTPSAPAPQA